MGARKKTNQKNFGIFPRDIQATLILSFGLLSLLFLLLGSLVLHQVTEVKRRTELALESYRRGSQTFARLADVTLGLERVFRDSPRYSRSQRFANWAEGLGRTQVEITSYLQEQARDAPSEAEKQALQDLQEGVKAYLQALEGTARSFSAAKVGGETNPGHDQWLLSRQKSLHEQGRRLLSLYQENALRHLGETTSLFTRFRLRLFLLMGTILLFSVALMCLSRWDIQRKTNQIQEERDFSRTLIQALGDGVVLFNLEGEIEYANPRLAEMLGYDEDRMKGKSYTEIFLSGDHSRWEEWFTLPCNRRVLTFESPLLRSDGSSLPALVTFAPRLSGAGQVLGCVAVIRDMTESKRAELSLRELARALEATDDIVVITDLEEKITYVNQAALRAYGYQREELIGRPVSALRTPDDHLFLGSEIREASLRGGWQGELKNIRKDGGVFPIALTTSLVRDEKANPYAIVGISRDIGEMKRIEQEVHERNKELAFLNSIAATMSQSLLLEETLDRVTDLIAQSLQVEGCEIYIQREGIPRPLQVACCGMERDYYQQQLLPKIDPGPIKPMALAEVPLVIDDLRKEGLDSLLSRGFLSYASIPIRSKGISVGVMNVARKRLLPFRSQEILLLEAVANQIGVFVENVRSFEREKRRAEELSVLMQVTQAVNSSLDLGEVLQSIVSMAAEIMGVAAANLMLLDEESQELQWSASLGLPSEWMEAVGNLKVGESISGLVVLSRSPLAILEMSEDPRFLYPHLAERFGFHSFLGVPLIFREKAIGGLYILTTEPRAFGEAEIRLLSAIASQAALAIENARLFSQTHRLAQDNLRRYQELRILYELGSAMRGINQLDQLLPIILTGVTFGGGLGFNRAILFLLDDKQEYLQGVLGLGPADSEEAWRIWRDLEARKISLLELVNSLSLEALRGSPFDALARSLKVPLLPEAGIIALTALERRSFNLAGRTGGEQKVNPEYEGRLGSSYLATVPLLAEDKVIGVILVDNLFNQRPISEDDLRFLTALANQAGMAIESARLYSRLEETNRQLRESHRQIVQMERLALLGEMSATVAHQIRNPLVAIGGFARRLSQADEKEGARRQYLEVIQREVKRLEQTVREILSVSREIRPRLVPSDLNQVVQECLVLYQDRIREQAVTLHLSLENNLPLLPLDATQMRHALSNLLDNALEVMPEGGELAISTRRTPEALHLEVSDSGPGISAEAMAALFDPFFTTKANGTGLGLTLTHRIITNHGGKIEAQNLPVRGARFSISLPLSEGSLHHFPEEAT